MSLHGEPAATAHGGFWERLRKGTRWAWVGPSYRDALPVDLDETVMALESRDRLHAKQGRSTARVVFHGPDGALAVYLKRHFQLPWPSRLLALVNPKGRHTPGAAEFAHLQHARTLGLAVPEVVAAGERIGPWGRLQSYLMVAELTGWEELNTVLPKLARTLAPDEFETLKRGLAGEMAAIAATLHKARVFHKDLYLCHYFLDLARRDQPGQRLAVIDLHRLAEHRFLSERWRSKDLGQLLYSTAGIDEITCRDKLRFWVHYQRQAGLGHPRRQLRRAVTKASRYARHNR